MALFYNNNSNQASFSDFDFLFITAWNVIGDGFNNIQDFDRKQVQEKYFIGCGCLFCLRQYVRKRKKGSSCLIYCS